jgi:hypothetical protein
MVEAMNSPKDCHHEERSDVVIHLEFQMDCRAPPSVTRNDKR